MADAKPLPRDVFIETIYNEALKNKNIYFISADLGAKALDDFRKNLPNQSIHAGISEQNMIGVAAGMSANGKIVYMYAMAPFVTLRCYEQIKVALAAMKLPATVIGVGSGFSYDDAGPTHYSTEDISCMRALPGIEVLNPSDTRSVVETAKLTFNKPALRYVRLDRKFLDDIYPAGDNRFLEKGIVEIEKGDRVCVVTNGLMMGTVRKVTNQLKAQGQNLGVIDFFRLKPYPTQEVASVLAKYDTVITVEEHFLDGGMGSIVLECLSDMNVHKKVVRIGLEDRYYFENGTRSHLHKLAKIDAESLMERFQQVLEHRTPRD